MGIESISSGSNVQPTRTDAAQEARTAERAQARLAEQKAERKESEQAAQPRPVTNALGQQTGTLINITA